MKTDWRSFWKGHVEEVGDDPFKQVGRTLDGEPMSRDMFEKQADQIIDRLELNVNDIVLDLCCGNGILSIEIAKSCKQVLAVDFSTELIENIPSPKNSNVIGIVSDVMEIDFKADTFSHIVMAAALQHFSFAQSIQLFKKMSQWIKPGGKLMITDITDHSSMWNFYNTQEREATYFQHTMEGISILGTWYDRIWLEKLAKHSGFRKAVSLDQNEDYWYAHYRFDLLCQK